MSSAVSTEYDSLQDWKNQIDEPRQVMVVQGDQLNLPQGTKLMRLLAVIGLVLLAFVTVIAINFILTVLGLSQPNINSERFIAFTAVIFLLFLLLYPRYESKILNYFGMTIYLFRVSDNLWIHLESPKFFVSKEIRADEIDTIEIEQRPNPRFGRSGTLKVTYDGDNEESLIRGYDEAGLTKLEEIKAKINEEFS